MVSLTNRVVQAAQPRFNEHICEGIAVEHLENVERYINQVILNAVSDMFCNELVYEGYEICNPYEMMKALSQLTSRANLIALEESDVYVIRLNFSFRGEKLKPQYLMMPLVSRGGLMKIRGSM